MICRYSNEVTLFPEGAGNKKKPLKPEPKPESSSPEQHKISVPWYCGVFGIATHCEHFVQRNPPNSTSWWTLCRLRSHSSASRAGQSPPRIFCGNTPSVWKQASDGNTGSDDKRNKRRGRKWKKEQSHYLCFRAVWGTRVINASHITTRVSGCQAPAQTECNLKISATKLTGDW